MSIEVWLAFTVASAILVAIPGPTVMLVVTYVLSQGRRTAWATVPGVALGDLTAITASLAGAGAVMATSAVLFSVMKFAGAAYLVWLGIKLWRSAPVPAALDDRSPVSSSAPSSAPSSEPSKAPSQNTSSFASLFWKAFIVTALNPKGMVFFVAFVPQFVTLDQPLIPQFAILVLTFVTVATANVILWALLTGTLRRHMERPGLQQAINKAGATFLIGAGFITATLKQ